MAKMQHFLVWAEHQRVYEFYDVSAKYIATFKTFSPVKVDTKSFEALHIMHYAYSLLAGIERLFD